MTIRYYAKKAKSARARRYLTMLADCADRHAQSLAAMPDWAKGYGCGTRVPVSVKVAHDGLEVETWTSGGGKQMSRVHWASGWCTEYVGDLSHRWVEWDQ